jgi:DNA-binding MarR family transcriptional regulator
MAAMTKMQDRATASLSQADYEALANLRFALRRFSAFSAAAAHARGLPPQQHQALLAIRGCPAGTTMTVGALAESLFVAPHTAAELVGRLADSGLVRRIVDPDDRRRQTLTLTRRAETMLARLSAAHLNEIRTMAPELIRTLRRIAPGRS